MHAGRVLVLAMLAGVPAALAQGTLSPSPHPATCYLDVNGDSLRGSDEPVYLQQTCSGGVAACDARLMAWGGLPGGTLVNGSHPDAGLQTAPIASAYAFYDSDGGGGYNLGDPLFLAFGALPGPAKPGDLPLTGSDAFMSLRGGDSRVGLPLQVAPVAVGGESYAERDGQPGFTTGDTLYLDLDGSGSSTLGDLRLAVPARPPASSSSNATSTSANVTSGPSSTLSSSAATEEPSVGSPSTAMATGTPKGTPISWSIPALAIGLAVLVRRRR